MPSRPFYKSVAEYVEKQQYAGHTFEVELFAKPGEFNVSKGEVIGFSGNSGSSEGLIFTLRS
jgi:murein DD-endopeptidase MepM/ murein hydrolase activator NlpD